MTIFGTKTQKLEEEEEKKLYDDQLQIKINEEYRLMIPRASTDEIDEMKKSLKRVGQKHPVIVDSQTFELVDGYTRYVLLKKLGMRVWYELRYFANKRDILTFILVSNVHRRHLRPFDKVKLFRPLYDVEIKEAKQRLKEISLHHQEYTGKGKALDKFAKKIDVSPDTAKASLVILDKGSSKQIEAVKKGAISVTQMAKEIARKQSADERKRSYSIIIRNGKGRLQEKILKKLSGRQYNNMVTYLKSL